MFIICSSRSRVLEHLLTALRYVERNPLCAGMVSSGEKRGWGEMGAGVEFSGQAEFVPILYRDATTITTCCWRLCLPRYQSRGRRVRSFARPGDYLAFRKILIEAQDWLDVPLLACCVMPNHWHLVLWPAHDGDLSEFMWLTVTHTQRDHAHYHTPGTGPLYQGRFKAFPIAEDEHLLTVLRYVERNPLRAGMVCSVAHWCWSSLGQVYQHLPGPSLQEGPVAKPAEWLSWVDGVETEAELRALRRCVIRGTPYGSAMWQKETS